jgi:hypothetical protein
VYYYLGRTKEAIKPGSGTESFRTFLSVKSGAEPTNTMVADARRLSAAK